MTRQPAAHPIRRPVLAPGLRVLSRRAGELEIGLTTAHRLRIADTPAVRRVLGVLGRGETPGDTPANRRALADLAPVLRDGDGFVDSGLSPGEVAAAVLRHPHGAGDRLRSRSRARVQVAGDADLIGDLDPEPLLRRSGLTLCSSDERPSVVLLVAHGEPARADVDPLLRLGIPHLVLRSVESEIVLGPFVVPGRTACCRCVAVHVAATEPGRAPALPQQVRAPRFDGVAEPLDSAVAATALGWATADLVRFAEGDRPTTWSATATFASGLASVRATPWLRHPGCGCSWGAREDVSEHAGASVTMGA